MVAPAAVIAAGWTIEEIAAGVGILGTAGGAVGSASAQGGTGWNFDGPDGSVHYPKEIGTELFLGDGHETGGVLIRFFADGYLWNNECFVRFHGLFSHTNEPPMCYANGNDPLVPANRFMEVGFTKGGEELSSGLLSCGLSVYERMHGTADEPYLWLHAAGHFDPVGTGDAEYGFTLYLSTYGTVHLGNIDTQTGGISITESGDQIDVKLDQ
jgi:hypothetical protein